MAIAFTTLIRYSGLLANAFREQNANVDVRLTANWSRAGMTYQNVNSPWYGESIYAMARDVRAGDDAADAASGIISGVIPVGEAWNRAIAGGLAARIYRKCSAPAGGTTQLCMRSS